MPSLTATTVNTDRQAADSSAAADASPTPTPSPHLSRCGASEEHLSMEHVVIYTAPEVFAKKPIRRVTCTGEVLEVPAAECADVEQPFALLPGESPIYYSTLPSGVLITLTNFRLFVLLRGGGGNSFYNIPAQSIDNVECRDMFYLHVACKDGRIAKITFENNELCLTWWRILNTAIAAPSKLEDIFAFAFYAWCKEERADDGLCLRSIDIYQPADLKAKGSQVDDDKLFTELEFSRLAFDPSIWRITELNKDYRFCSTYPKYWIVPASITDSEIESAGRYRSMRRVPAVVWRNRGNGAVLVRCSQPESGIFGWRSPADEALLNAIASCCARQKGAAATAASVVVMENGGLAGVTSCSSAAQACVAADAVATSPDNIPGDMNASPVVPPVVANAKNMLILDARSYTAAWANRAKGGGFESAEYYQKCEIQFLGLANIHSIRYSFQKLRSLCWESAETNWFQSLDACQWIYHLWALLASALRVVEALHIDARPVVIHCSDGWDRTTQIVALAKLFLDPYYRTMMGFKELIEREWIAFGHKFAERSGTTVGDVNQRAPVFLQWLDCVHYVLKENPCAFEFNEAYLVKLAQHVYSGLFGTFLCNSISDYVNANVASRTYSIWSYLHPANRQFRNVFYKSDASRPILPRFQQRDLAEIWRTVYCPPSDPTNLRPRSFSTASLDGDNNNNNTNDSSSAAATGVNATAASNERTLTRAHSCDNLVPSSPPATSLDNLPSIVDNSNKLHRTGSDSSLTKIASSGGNNGCPPNAVDKDTEEVLRSLVDSVEKRAARASKDVVVDGEIRTTPAAVADIPGAHVQQLTNGLGVDIPPLSAAANKERRIDDPAAATTTIGIDQQQAQANSQESAMVSTSTTATTTAATDEIARGTDISTSTTDLNNCCGGDNNVFGVIIGGNQHRSGSTTTATTNGHRYRRINNGFVCDFNNDNNNTTCASSSLLLAAVGGERISPNEECTAAASSNSPSSPAFCRPNAAAATSISAKTNGAGTTRKGKPSTRDMIDSDGMTKTLDATQQRVREIVHNYDRQLENLTTELEQLRALVRLQHQNGHTCFCNDRRKHLSIDEGPDSLEPHSFGSHGNASDSSWDAVEEREVQPVPWMPNHASNRCTGCDAIFTLINRRHHCRRCGKLFCNPCSSYESAVPEESLYDPVRVCGWCYASLRQQLQMQMPPDHCSPSSSSYPQPQPPPTNRHNNSQQQKTYQPAAKQPQPQDHNNLQQASSAQHQVLPQQKVSA